MEAFSEHEILVGTYEEFVLGYKIVPELKDSEKCSLVPSFTTKSHCGPVRYIIWGGPRYVFDIVHACGIRV